MPSPAARQAAFGAWAGNPDAMYVAGATDVLQLLQEDVVAPETVDRHQPPAARHGSRPARAAPGSARWPVCPTSPTTRICARISRCCTQALRETASPQVRNLATMGGNLLQRTRCLYFRDKTSPCNKRVPGSGCPAIDGANRMNAILGGSDRCIAAYPGDMAVALLVMGARVQIRGPDGERSIAVEDLHRMPGADPSVDTTLKPGEIITEIVIPANDFAANAPPT